MLSSEHQVAKKLRIKPYTLRNERLQGAISFVKIRCRYYYADEQIADYIRSKTIPVNLPPRPVDPDRKTSTTPIRTSGTASALLNAAGLVTDEPASRTVRSGAKPRPISGSRPFGPHAQRAFSHSAFPRYRCQRRTGRRTTARERNLAKKEQPGTKRILPPSCGAAVAPSEFRQAWDASENPGNHWRFRLFPERPKTLVFAKASRPLFSFDA